MKRPNVAGLGASRQGDAATLRFDPRSACELKARVPFSTAFSPAATYDVIATDRRPTPAFLGGLSFPAWPRGRRFDEALEIEPQPAHPRLNQEIRPRATFLRRIAGSFSAGVLFSAP
jgi:hypothetical protein